MESKVDQAVTDHGAEKQVELEIDCGKMKQEEEDQPSTSGSAQPEVEQQDESGEKHVSKETSEAEPYSIAIGRERRQIQRPQRYLNSVTCTLD